MSDPRASSPTRALLFASVAVLTAVPAHLALGAACCGGDSGLGQRLALDERAATTLSFELAERFGGFDGAGAYHGLPHGDADHAMRFDASWAVRVHSRFEVGADVPVLIDVRTLGEHASGAGVGDLSAFARVTIAQVDDAALWPALYATTTVFIPTGRPAALSTHLGADTTGQGVGEIRTTLTLAKSFSERWFAQIDGALSFFTRSDDGGVPIERAPRLRCDALTGPLFSIGRQRGLGFAVGFAYEAEGAPATASFGVSAVRLARIIGTSSVDVTPRASLIASFDSALPVSGLGANDIAAVAFSIGGRYAFGIDD